MKFNIFKSIFIAVTVLLSIGSSVSAEQKAVTATSAASTAKSAIAVVKQPPKKALAVTKARLVDINSAGRNELKTLPGVTDSVADKIIASRPFGSKSQLTTRGILPRDDYESLKGLVIAKQNAATTSKLLSK